MLKFESYDAHCITVLKGARHSDAESVAEAEALGEGPPYSQNTCRLLQHKFLHFWTALLEISIVCHYVTILLI